MNNWKLFRRVAASGETCILCGKDIPVGDSVVAVEIEVKVLFKKLVEKQAHLRCAAQVADEIKKLAR